MTRKTPLAHGYFDLRLDTIWDTASVSLPELIFDCQADFR
jgi:uncharacterized protein with HEPN domain